MRIVTRVTSLFRTLFRRDRIGEELDAELRGYLDMLAEEKMAEGLTRAEAYRAARLELGGVEQVKAEIRERRVGAAFETLLQDVRYAFRQLGRNPGFTAVAVLTLALGIGANTAVFSVVSQVLLRPLPFGEEDRVVTVWNTHVEGRLRLSENEALSYAALDAQLASLGVYTFGSFALSGQGEAERLPGAFAAAGVLESLRVPLVAGRAFTSEEDRPNADRVVLLGESIWERRFARAPEVVGSTIVLNGLPRTVIGILPAGLRFPDGFTGPALEVVAPLRLERAAPDPRNIHYLSAVARLRDGVSLEAVRTALDAAAQRVAERLGTLPETFSATAFPVRDDVVGSVRPALLILLAAVGLVLLVACVNLANLLLARADTRMREMAVRASLGAGRGRLVRQLSTELGVLALLGGTAGLIVGLLGARGLVALSPPGLPRFESLSLDPRMFVFCLLVTAATGLLIGFLPARRLAAGEPAEALKGSGRATARRRGTRTRRGLITAQVALAAMLSIGAGLLVRSLLELGAVDPGFEDAGVLTLQLTLPSADYPDHDARRALYGRLLQELDALPGVEAVGGTTRLPLSGPVGDWGVRIRGRGPDGLGESGPAPDWMIVTPGYFEAMRIPVRRGRTFERQDVTDGFQAVVINEAFARRHWPQGEALGAELRMTTNIDTLWRTVVGIVTDVRQTELTEPPRPAMYLPYAQFPSTTDDFVVSQLDLAVRTRLADVAGLASNVRAVVAELAPDLPVANLRPMTQVTGDAAADHRFQGFLFTGFAALALALVVVGVYGVTAYLVARRTRELGVRIALGASPARIRRLVRREGLAMTAVGLGIGLSAAWLLARLMSGLLYGVTARDPLTFLAVPVLLALTVLLATAVPAVRAARIDPQQALRDD